MTQTLMEHMLPSQTVDDISKCNALFDMGEGGGIQVACTNSVSDQSKSKIIAFLLVCSI